MNSPDPVPQAPAVVPAMPWYQSKVIVAFITIAVTRALAWLNHRYQVDLTAFGIGVSDIVAVAMDGLTAAAVAYGWAGRVAASPVTMSKAKAATINASPPTLQPPGDTQ